MFTNTQEPPVNNLSPGFLHNFTNTKKNLQHPPIHAVCVWSVSKGQIFPLIICAWPGLCQHLAWRGDVWWEDPPGHRHLMGEHTLPWWWWRWVASESRHYTLIARPCQPSLTLSLYADKILPSFFYVMFRTFVKNFWKRVNFNQQLECIFCEEN